jgi:ABC-type Na+ efflux pump permease subunit
VTTALRALAALIAWAVLYAICLYPVSFFIAALFGFGLRVTLNYSLASDPQGAQLTIGIITVLVTARSPQP